jgi:hypothetical protein
MNRFLLEQGHALKERKNEKDDFTHVGFGVVYGREGGFHLR